jgi:hypothetical protein
MSTRDGNDLKISCACAGTHITRLEGVKEPPEGPTSDLGLLAAADAIAME